MAAVDPVAVMGDTTLEDTAGALGAYLDQQVAIEQELSLALAAVRKRITTARKAVEVLTGGSAKPVSDQAKSKPSKAAKGAKQSRRTGSQAAAINNWRPSERLVAKTLKGLEELTANDENGATISRLAAHIGTASESVKRSLEVLRERDQARFLGMREFPTKKPGRTMKARAYRVMPQVVAPKAITDDNSADFVSALVETI